MNGRDLLELSIGNLWRTKLRTFLTMAGVVIAVAAFVALLSFGAGNRKFITDQYTRFGLFSTMEVYARTNRTDDTTEVVPLDKNALEELSRIPGVKLAFPFNAFEVTASIADTHIVTRARSLTEEGLRSGVFKGIMGQLKFSSDTAAEVIVSDEFMRLTGIDDPESLVGHQLVLSARSPSLDSAVINLIDDQEDKIWSRLKDIHFDSLFNSTYRQHIMRQELNEGLRKFIDGLMNRQLTVYDTLKILGVADTKSGIQTYPVVITEKTAQHLSGHGMGVGSDPVAIFSAMRNGTFFNDKQTTDSRNYPKVTLEFDPYTPYQHVKDSVQALGFRAFSYAEQFEEMQRFFLYYNLGLGIIGLIAMVTAALGIVNTMVMAITERKREIGIIKSLGADERNLRMIFLVESMVIGSMGAITGILCGWIATRIVSRVFQVILIREEIPVFDPFALPFWLIVLAFVFSLVVSLLAGLYPAIRASRVDPVEALRSE